MKNDHNSLEAGTEREPPPPLAMQRKLAQTILSPAVNAGHAVRKWSGLEGTPFDRGLLVELEAQIAAIASGKSDRPAEIMAAHIETLDALFYSLLGNAHAYRGNPMMAEKIRLALKVQSQIRATVQALADLKNPRPVAYVQQANIAHGPQQINNGLSVAWPAEVVNGIQPSELLEARNDTRLDTPTTGATSSVDTQLEAVDAINRPSESSR